MKIKHILSFVLTLSGILFIIPVQAELDEMQMRHLKQHEPATRWDNVEDFPEWVAGNQPDYSIRAGMHLVKLEPGQWVKVRIPKGERLRITSQNGALPNEALTLDISDGSGLYARLPGILSEDKRSLLGPIAWHASQLALVSRPENKKEAVHIALFISRHETLGEIAPYRDLISLNAPTVQMRRADVAGAESYSIVEPGKPQTIKIQGPTRLAFENRLAYPEGESRLLQTYQLHVTLNGIPQHTLEFETSEETAYPVYVEGVVRTAGRLQIGYLHVPKGEHVLTLDVTANLYARLLKQENPDYVFPNLNAPKKVSNKTENRALFWEMTDEQIRQAAENKTSSPSLKEHTALRVVRDNGRREGGMLGTMMMQASAEKHRDYPDIQTVADELKGYHTFYRDVLPANKEEKDDQYMAWFIVNPLHALGEQGKGIVISEQFTQEILSRTASAYFVEIPVARENTPESKYLYHLPARSTPSYLRIIVDKKALAKDTKFYLQLGKSEPILMQVRERQELPPKEYALTQGEAGLATLPKLQEGLLSKTLSARFSAEHVPAPIISAHVLELPLPTDIQEIRLWKTELTDEPVSAALQYRASKPFALSETEYAETIRQIEPYASVLEVLKRALHHKTKVTSRAEKELQNHWLPLLRFLKKEHALFLASVGPDIRASIPTEAKDNSNVSGLSEKRRGVFRAECVQQSKNTRNKRKKIRKSKCEEDVSDKAHLLVEEAQRREKQAEWLPALETWSKVKSNGKSKYLNKAYIGIITALLNLGEHYLAEQQLRGLMLYSKDDALRSWAFKTLLDLNRKRDDREAMVTTAAAQVILKPNLENIEALEEAFLENQQFDFSLMVGLIIPAQQHHIPTMLRAAYQMGWWGTFDKLKKRLDSPKDRAFWSAIRSQAFGDTQQALVEFSEAGAQGTAWKNQILKAEEILKKLLSPEVKTKEQGILDWQMWHAAHPGPTVWHEDIGAIQDYTGMKTLYSIDRDVYEKTFQGSRDRPVLLEIVGPVRIRLEARPLISTSSELPVDGWLRIQAEKSLRVFPINNIRASQGLQIVGENHYSVGHKTFTEFNIAPGIHRLQIDAQDLPFLLRVFVAHPEALIPLLPPLNRYTAHAIFYGEIQATPNTEGTCLLSTCLTFIPADHSKHATSYRLRRFPVPQTSTPPSVVFQKKGHGVRQAKPAFSGVKIAKGASAGKSGKNGKIYLKSDRKASKTPSSTCRKKFPSSRPASFCRKGSKSHASSLCRKRPSISSQARCKKELIGFTKRSQIQKVTTQRPQKLESFAKDWPEAEMLDSGTALKAIEAHSVDNKKDIIRRMTLFLWLAEQDEKRRAWATAQGEHLALTHPLISELHPLYNRLTRAVSWLPFTHMGHSAGLRYIEEKGWQPEVPAIRIRKALLPEGPAEERVLFGTDRLAYALKNLKESKVTVHLKAEDVPYLAPHPLTALYQLDNALEKKIVLSPDKAADRLNITVPEGDHTLRIRIENPIANQFLRVRMTESRTAPEIPKVERAYFVATKKEPIRFSVVGPGVLRIDERIADSLVASYRLVNKKQEEIVLKPKPSQTEALFSVSQRILTPTPTKLVQTRVVIVPLSPVPEPYARLEQPKSASRVIQMPPLPAREGGSGGRVDTPLPHVALEDGLSPGGQQSGTWSFMLGERRRKDVLEESKDHKIDLEDFTEIEATHRFFSENRRTYFKTTFLEHVRTHGGATLGVEETLHHRPIWYPINFRLKSGALSQNPNGNRWNGLSGKREWSLHLTGSMFQKRQISPKAYHTPELSGLVRYLSLRNTKEYNARDVDQDIFTSYASNHRKYIEVSDVFYHRPWLDALWYAGASVASNPNFNLFNPDNVKFKFGWKQLLGVFEIHPDFQYARYIPKRTTRRSIGVGLTWNAWSSSQNLFEVSLQVRRKIDVQSTTGFLNVTWHTSHGRGYRDFHPSEVDFIDIRTRKIPTEPNNTIVGDFGE